jgi:hypothetical protein
MASVFPLPLVLRTDDLGVSQTKVFTVSTPRSLVRRSAFRRLSPTFRSVPKSHQRNIVMCESVPVCKAQLLIVSRRDSRRRLHADSLNIFFTLVALGLELAAAKMMSGDYQLYQFQCVRMSSIVIVGLYTFELIFRFDMRPPL